MPLKKKPFSYYAVLSLLTLVVVISGLGNILVDEINDNLTETHLRLFPETVRTILDQHPDALDWFMQPPGTTLPEPVARLSEGLLSIPGVFRIKVWSSDGTILWSDRAELIGKNFAQNHHFQSAANGKVVYNNQGFRKLENMTERGERIVVEVYAPVYDDDRIIGVVELYESDQALSARLIHSSQTIWKALAVAGVIIYLLMLVAFLLSQDVVAQFSRTKYDEPGS